MPVSDDSGRRLSSVLDAVFERLEDTPDRVERAETMFRAEALEQLDVAEEIDNQLSLVGRRAWLVLVGGLLLCAAALVWAGVTTTQRTVDAVGRVVDLPGVGLVSASSAGTVTAMAVRPGDHVDVGASLGEVVLANGDLSSVRAAVEGTVWQVLVVAGEQVEPGDAMVSVLPPGSGGVVLVAVAEADATLVRVGMRVDLASPHIGGVVEAVGEPLPADVVARRIGRASPADSTGVIIAVRLDSELSAGQQVSLRIVESSRSILRALFGVDA